MAAKPSPSKPARTRKSSVALGARQTARIASKRVIKDSIANTPIHPAIKLALVAGFGALASYFINKSV